MNVLLWLGVALAGGAGAVLRFLVDRAVAGRTARSFPLGTTTVNLSGAVALGVIGGLALPPAAVLLAGTALIGSYTTFSTWMLETHRLGAEHQFRTAAANLVVSVVLGLLAVFCGQWLAGSL